MDEAECAHAELTHVEGLPDKFVGAAAKTAGERLAAGAGGKNEDRNPFVAGSFAQPLQDLKTVNPGHLEIEHQKIVIFLAQARQSIRSRRYRFDLHAIWLQRGDYQGSHVGIVVRNQDRRWM